MGQPDLKVVPLYESNLRDPVAELRHIADQMEAGEYGEVASATLITMGDTMEVFSFGAESDAGSAALLLQAALIRLCTAVERHGR